MDTERLYVGNLHFDVTTDDLIRWFDSFGHITDCVINETEGPPRRRYGFVQFDTVAQADAAAKALDSTPDPDHGRRIVIRSANIRSPRYVQ